MNKKAEDFKKYLETKAITCFTVEEIDDDQLNTVVFRSTIEVEGVQLPTIIILDSSIYGMVRNLTCCGRSTALTVNTRCLNIIWAKTVNCIWKAVFCCLKANQKAI